MIKEQVIQQPPFPVDFATYSPIVQHSIQKEWVKMQVVSQIIRIAAKKLGSYAKAVTTLRALKKKYRDAFGESMLSKIAYVDGRYYWRLGVPGFPSPASVQLHHNELNRHMGRQEAMGLRILFLAITKKCPLRCRHCFEWERLHQPESLRTADLVRIVQKYQDFGATQIMLSGGEPLLRLKTVFSILKAAKPTTDFWLISTGVGLNAARARELKEAGLTGIWFSLDHHDPQINNQIRGHERAYEWAVNGVRYARDAGLVTTLSLCATAEYVSETNLANYLELAKKLGVVFVQINEIRPAGPDRDQIRSLSAEQVQLLEKTYSSYNADPEWSDFPIINYAGAGC